MAACPYCGSDDLLDISVMERAEPIAHVCRACGRRSAPVVFRIHHYSPPLRYAVFTRDLVATMWSGEVGAPTVAPVEFRSIHCGPPADQPRVPTPDEILDAARGLADPWREP